MVCIKDDVCLFNEAGFGIQANRQFPQCAGKNGGLAVPRSVNLSTSPSGLLDGSVIGVRRIDRS